MIVFESLYSMDGDIARRSPRSWRWRRKEQRATLYRRGVHAVGLYGPRGGGLSEREGRFAARIDIIEGTLAKGFGLARRLYRGERGDCRDVVRSFAPQFTLHLNAAAERRRERGRCRGQASEATRAPSVSATSIWRSSSSHRRLRAAGLPAIPDNPSHIVPACLTATPGHCCRAASELLLERHAIYIQPINYPTGRQGGPLPVARSPRRRPIAKPKSPIWSRLWSTCGRRLASSLRSARDPAVPRQCERGRPLRLSGDEARGGIGRFRTCPAVLAQTSREPRLRHQTASHSQNCAPAIVYLIEMPPRCWQWASPAKFSGEWRPEPRNPPAPRVSHRNAVKFSVRDLRNSYVSRPLPLLCGGHQAELSDSCHCRPGDHSCRH